MTHPSVVFVCVKNGGKSQIAAALMRSAVGREMDVLSAGTAPGSGLNEQARAVVEEVGATFDGEYPKPLRPQMIQDADRVVVIGSEAVVEPVEGMRGTIENWEVDEPSARGIEGAERMRLVRDDIARRVDSLVSELRG